MGPPVTIVTYEAFTVRKRGILECPFPRLSAKLSVPFHKNPVTDCRMPPFWAPIQRKRKAIIWHKFLYHDMLGKSILQLTISFGKEQGGTKINLHTFIYILIIGRKILSLLGFSTTTAYLLVHRSIRVWNKGWVVFWNNFKYYHITLLPEKGKMSCFYNTDFRKESLTKFC